MTDKTRSLSDKFMLRLPDGMRDRIKRAAEINNRSMNAEIVATLNAAFPEVAPSMAETMQDIMALSGEMQAMAHDQRLAETAKKQREINSKSIPATLTLEANTLVLEFEGGDSKFQINLSKPTGD